MPNGLARVFSAEDEKPHIGIGQSVFDEAFNAEIFGMECADNRQTIRDAVFETRGKLCAIQRTHRDGRAIFRHLIVAGKWRPALSFRWSLSGTQVKPVACLWERLSEGIGGNSRVTDRT